MTLNLKFSLLIFCLFFIFNVRAQEAVLFRDADEIKEGLTESQWVTFIGFEGMRLVSRNAFILDSKEVYLKKENLMGPTISVARKWYLVGNLTTTFEPMIYYISNNDEEIRTPNTQSISTYKVSEYSEEVAYYGTRLAQSLGYTFEFKHFYIEPFFQVFAGYGMGRMDVHYHWDTHLASEHEEYDAKIKEKISHQGIAAGLQIIAQNGYMSYFKVSKNTLTYRDRDTAIYNRDNGTFTETKNSQKIKEPLDKFSITVGLGYIF